MNPWVGKIPWSKAWQPTPVFLLGESHGQRSLADYSPWNLIESDTTEATETLSLFSSFMLFLLCLLNRSLPSHLWSSLSLLPFPSLDFQTSTYSEHDFKDLIHMGKLPISKSRTHLTAWSLSLHFLIDASTWNLPALRSQCVQAYLEIFSAVNFALFLNMRISSLP